MPAIFARVAGLYHAGRGTYGYAISAPVITLKSSLPNVPDCLPIKGPGITEDHVLTFRGLDGRHAVLCIVLLCAWLGPVQAFARALERDFDLPEQSLERALEQFSVVSGWSVMYPASLADGRTSRAVRGVMLPALALQQLLEDTGLEAQTVADDRVVLRERAGTPLAAAPGPASDDRRRRFGQVQHALRRAFCDDPLLRPGDYRAELAFHVTADGRVDQPELRTGTGEARRDQRLLQTIGDLQLPAAAADLPQPIRLHIQPVPEGRDCGSSRQPSP
ncbi:TonB-dependent receptor [Stenotrophomonas sp. PS02289]|uniref:TonB-dependent receptor n=1 Tax=Stenotrophomonas sp. PS02289 TaxID=2991422 RepID=UPI00249B68AD|nr:TonB-dependent receptor [Stenotrophomonas sp. PS02289]